MTISRTLGRSAWARALVWPNATPAAVAAEALMKRRRVVPGAMEEPSSLAERRRAWPKRKRVTEVEHPTRIPRSRFPARRGRAPLPAHAPYVSRAYRD